ncbi:MAG: negative regulator of sigma-B (phosphoserine phosphatase) [Saprospiraceae bacterium]|jgi:negative regulator of sigma-B (phosphoserine phosphatase)
MALNTKDELDCFLYIQPLLSKEECGDIGVFVEYENKLFVALIDVLGHGAEAYEVAVRAKYFLERHYREDLTEMIKGLHLFLKGSRGLAGNLSRLNLDTGDFEYTGIGNVEAKIVGADKMTFTNRDGIVGHRMPSPKIEKVKMCKGDVLYMSTDGIKECIALEEHFHLKTDTAEFITEKMVKQFGKQDDKACLIVKY